jgi:hypothetical protein
VCLPRRAGAGLRAAAGAPLALPGMLEAAQAVMMCVSMGWMCLVTGPAATGKTSLIRCRTCPAPGFRRCPCSAPHRPHTGAPPPLPVLRPTLQRAPPGPCPVARAALTVQGSATQQAGGGLNHRHTDTQTNTHARARAHTHTNTNTNTHTHTHTHTHRLVAHFSGHRLRELALTSDTDTTDLLGCFEQVHTAAD